MEGARVECQQCGDEHEHGMQIETKQGIYIRTLRICDNCVDDILHPPKRKVKPKFIPTRWYFIKEAVRGLRIAFSQKMPYRWQLIGDAFYDLRVAFYSGKTRSKIWDSWQ
jgi:hypothetical protein